MMLETTATRLWSEPGGPHFGSPDKEPAVRLRVLEDAGRSAVPFTTGVLLGIGEDYAERVDAIREIRASAQRHGHVQEVIVQNFRAKPRTAMAGARRPGAAGVRRRGRGHPAAARPEGAGAGAAEPVRLHRARAAAAGRRRRLGRGLAADARPRQPRAAVAEHRQAGRADRRGRVRAARAAGRPAAVRAAARAVAGPAGAPARRRAGRPGRAGRRGPAARSGCRGRSRTRPWTSSGPGRPARRGRHRRAAPATGAATSTPSTATGPSCASGRRAARDGHSTALAAGDREVLAALLHAEHDPAGLSDAEYLALLGADGADLEALCALADAVRARRRRRRRHLRGEPEHQLHQRLLHRLPVLRLRPAAHRRRRLHAVDGAGRRPGRRGVGGRRHRDLHAGRHPPRPARHRVLRPGRAR